jgi:hypothetical protein
MVHMSTSLILPCWSSSTVVGITVDVLLGCIRSWSLLCLLPQTPISIVPSLTTTVARSHNSIILCIAVLLHWWWCKAWRLKDGELYLTLGSLESLCCNLHPLLLTGMKDRSLRRRAITKLLVASLGSSALHLPVALHNCSSFSWTKAFQTCLENCQNYELPVHM